MLTGHFIPLTGPSPTIILALILQPASLVLFSRTLLPSYKQSMIVNIYIYIYIALLYIADYKTVHLYTPLVVPCSVVWCHYTWTCSHHRLCTPCHPLINPPGECLKISLQHSNTHSSHHFYLCPLATYCNKVTHINFQPHLMSHPYLTTVCP